MSTDDRVRPSDCVTTDAVRQRYLASGLWDAETLPGRVTRHAAEHGEAVAVVDQDGARERSYADLERDADRVARQLIELGVRPGEVVSVQLPNWYETVVVDLAVLKSGAVLNTLLPIYRAKEIRHMLTAGDVRVLFTPRLYRGHDHEGMVERLRDELPRLERHIAVPDPKDGEWPLDEMPAAAGYPGRSADAVSELIFTSGTEAEPKAVMHTEQTANNSVRSCWTSLGMTENDVVWMPSPIGHSTGLNFGVRMALYHGVPLVLQDRWDPAVAAELIECYSCSYSLVATPFVKDLIEFGQSRGRDLSSLERLGCGGAPIPPLLVDAAAELGVTTLRLYGSTEALVVTWNRPEDPVEKLRLSDGRAVENVEVEVRNGHGDIIVDEPGEIYVRGPNTSVGFLNDAGRTGATYSGDGWLRSGDIGCLDRDGFLTIIGRSKEIIIRGGLNIAPREIEELLIRHADIADAAVVGIPDDRLGELTCACLILREGVQPLTLGAVVDFCREQGLATYKLPQRLLVLEELPRTASGKVQKHKIVQMAVASSSVAANAR